MRETVAFLKELAANNNKQWFDANRARYRVLRTRFEELTAELIDGIGTFDAEVRGLKPKDCIFRINRDTRFSNDKSPYKTHFSAFIAPRGKKSGYAGYYFHVEPEGDGMIGHSLLAAGAVCIPPIVLKSIREEIVDNGDQMLEAIAAAKGFEISRYSSLKRTPAGFPTGTPYDELLRLKDVCLDRAMSEEELYDTELIAKTLAAYRTTHPFIAQVNRAIQYAYEEMM
ncbi:MAG: DUF2461 domain-containing protein [Rikenellaceae bacterium]|nr:DUF2461 domain-containing protein [Rikenellaceae bacterium]